MHRQLRERESHDVAGTQPEHAEKRQQIEDMLVDDRLDIALLLDIDEHLRTVGKYWGSYGITPNVWMQSKSIEAVRSLVALGQRVTILSDLVYRPWSLEGNRISRRNLSVTVPTMDVGAVWRRGGATSTPCRALLELFRSWKKSAR
ncbi:LysR family regulatory protein [Burkholderia lata]|nr:LysR family regulatory protein [Burkholderia lata]